MIASLPSTVVTCQIWEKTRWSKIMDKPILSSLSSCRPSVRGSGRPQLFDSRRTLGLVRALEWPDQELIDQAAEEFPEAGVASVEQARASLVQLDSAVIFVDEDPGFIVSKGVPMTGSMMCYWGLNQKLDYSQVCPFYDIIKGPCEQ